MAIVKVVRWECAVCDETEEFPEPVKGPDGKIVELKDEDGNPLPMKPDGWIVYGAQDSDSGTSANILCCTKDADHFDKAMAQLREFSGI